MAGRKRGPLTKPLNVICAVVEGRLASLPPAGADAKRAEIHRIASRARRTARETLSKHGRVWESRPSARARA